MSTTRRALRVDAASLLVSEVFDTIQGEGPSVGAPATFLRLGLCNLACVWCDTPYTWDAKRYTLADELTRQPLDALVADLCARKPRRLVVTGGEPMLQAEALEALLARLPHAVEVETAGTRAAGALAARVSQWNVSPKLASSGNPLAKRRVMPVLEDFAARADAFFKLVVADQVDLDEARALVRGLALPAERVWLMPEGRDHETLAARGRWLAEVCVAEGFRLGTRLHVTLWGDRRGV